MVMSVYGNIYGHIYTYVCLDNLLCTYIELKAICLLIVCTD